MKVGPKIFGNFEFMLKTSSKLRNLENLKL